jgi:hypothetical protein
MVTSETDGLRASDYIEEWAASKVPRPRHFRWRRRGECICGVFLGSTTTSPGSGTSVCYR